MCWGKSDVFRFLTFGFTLSSRRVPWQEPHEDTKDRMTCESNRLKDTKNQEQPASLRPVVLTEASENIIGTRFQSAS